MGIELDEEPGPRLSKFSFFLALNTYLHGTFVCEQLNKAAAMTVVDIDGNLPPKILGALHLMIRSFPGTEFSGARELPAIRQMLDFLDPYLWPPYRPESYEVKPLLYLPYD